MDPNKKFDPNKLFEPSEIGDVEKFTEIENAVKKLFSTDITADMMELISDEYEKFKKLITNDTFEHYIQNFFKTRIDNININPAEVGTFFNELHDHYIKGYDKSDIFDIIKYKITENDIFACIAMEKLASFKVDMTDPNYVEEKEKIYQTCSMYNQSVCELKRILEIFNMQPHYLLSLRDFKTSMAYTLAYLITDNDINITPILNSFVTYLKRGWFTEFYYETNFTEFEINNIVSTNVLLGINEFYLLKENGYNLSEICKKFKEVLTKKY